ncbi:MAG TPA: hypothetical protein VKV28_15965 [Candidatus Binataceae bacterium]|nr:hypothetical protein [Candidatus Binataceae bacterium]
MARRVKSESCAKAKAAKSADLPDLDDLSLAQFGDAINFLRLVQFYANGFAICHGGEKRAYSLEIGRVLYLRQ